MWLECIKDKVVVFVQFLDFKTVLKVLDPVTSVLNFEWSVSAILIVPYKEIDMKNNKS